MVRIGLEVHVQLVTKTKLFCGCPNRFIKEPNTYVCDYCIGLPGTKPRLNEKAVEAAMKIGLALNCDFPKKTFFSRKSYFYPDMAKDFQITQYEIPICANGHLDSSGQTIHIRRIQIEEDPARIEHVGGLTHAKYILIDYNRSGTPLCEIVTEPDFKDPAEARVFLEKLSSMLEYLGVYDSTVEGSMRVDANISVDSVRVEVKNVSGFKDVEKALSYEIVRQRSLISRGQQVKRETRGWDDKAGVTVSLRSKEEEEEYGYIFETDLPAINVSQKQVKELKELLPEFADQKIKRYERQLHITKEQAASITTEPDLAEAFEYVVKHVNPKVAANFFVKVLMKSLNWNTLRLKQTQIKHEWLAKIAKKMETGELTERSADLLMRDIIVNPRDPEDLARTTTRITNENELESAIEDALNKNPQAILDYRAGRSEAFEFIVGQVMRATKGRADPRIVREILKKKMEK